AHARRDDSEHRRLFDSSPLRTWQCSEHLLAEAALHVLALVYVTEQLDAAATYFFGRLQMGNDPGPEAWLPTAEAAAYLFTANAAAWRAFCADLDIAPEALVAANHDGWFLAYCEEHIPADAPSAEALQTLLRQHGQEVRKLVTMEDLLTGWREDLR